AEIERPQRGGRRGHREERSAREADRHARIMTHCASTPAGRLRVLPTLSVTVFFAATAALADIAPDPLAGSASMGPMDESKAGAIEMKREDVTLTLYDAFAIVDATFVMHNGGPAAT